MPLPSNQPNPIELEARGRIADINRLYDTNRSSHQNGFRTFWYKSGTDELRSAAELNDLLAAMDAIQPGASSLMFQLAWLQSQFLVNAEQAVGLDSGLRLSEDNILPKRNLVTINGLTRVE